MKIYPKFKSIISSKNQPCRFWCAHFLIKNYHIYRTDINKSVNILKPSADKPMQGLVEGISRRFNKCSIWFSFSSSGIYHHPMFASSSLADRISPSKPLAISFKMFLPILIGDVVENLHFSIYFTFMKKMIFFIRSGEHFSSISSAPSHACTPI
jgi:hypothetical protein